MFDEKYARAVSELENTTIWKSNYTPPIHGSSRKIGLNSRPPHYNSAAVNFNFYGLYYSVVWSVFEYFQHSGEAGNVRLMERLLLSLIPGLIFGILMALNYKYSASKNALSEWEEL